ncbi:MAG: hypothetical protein AB8G23_07370 [Myxococcota bacterium]
MFSYLGLAGLGLAIVVASGVRWFQLIQKVAIPRNRLGFHLAFGGGALLGLWAAIAGTGLLTTIVGGLTAIVGSAMPLLRLQSAQKSAEPTLAVGDQVLAFSALDEQGAEFQGASLSGKPYLLKFFRGHW